MKSKNYKLICILCSYVIGNTLIAKPLLGEVNFLDTGTFDENNHQVTTASRNIDFSDTGTFDENNQQTDTGSRGGVCSAQNDEQNNSNEVNNTIDKQEKEDLIALVPERGGFTVSEDPSFWVYIPDSSDVIRKAEFVLQVETTSGEYDIKEIARIDYNLKEIPGLIRITLPEEDKYKIKIGDFLYRWYFRIVCNNNNSKTVGGLLKRKDNNDFSQNNYDSYIENKIWYDALTDLAIRYGSNPEDEFLKNEWRLLLEGKSVNLKQLTEESRFGEVEIKEIE